jgi:hypothetical protein
MQIREMIIDTLNSRKASSRSGRLLTMTLTAIFATLLLCALPQTQIAQQTTAPEDEEEKMDEALRKLGYVSGQALQCQTAAAEKKKFEKTALDIANGILRLFGSDRAFYFAAAYGAGFTEKIEQSKCSEAIRRYETAIGKLKVLTNK